jgi:uncharacterized protein (TIGR02678 family)
MTAGLARVAAQLDDAEREDFQLAARTLLAHPLVTADWPSPVALPLIRRFEEPLRNEFSRMCRWRLDLGSRYARLLRRPAGVTATRPALSRTKRPFTPWAYAYWCLVLSALESVGTQTSISALAAEVTRIRAGDDALPVDLTAYEQRKAFVDAVGVLEQLGILTVLDGDTDAFLSAPDEPDGDALYDVDADAAGHLLVSPPSVLEGIDTPEALLIETYPATPDGAAARVRHRVVRRLLLQPTVYFDELDEEERAYARQRRGRLRDEIERLTGCWLEVRTEGMALIDAPSAVTFPGSGAVAHIALIYGGELAAAAPAPAGTADGTDRTESGSPEQPGGPASTPATPAAPIVGRRVGAEAAEAAWARVVESFEDRFTGEFRDDHPRLRRLVVELLDRLDLVRIDGDDLVVRPAMARYRADVRLPDPTPTLFGPDGLSGGDDA